VILLEADVLHLAGAINAQTGGTNAGPGSGPIIIPSTPTALRTVPTAPTAPEVGDITTTIAAGSSASTINAAIAAASPGDVIALRGGTYTLTANLSFEAVGTEANPVTIMGYPGEWPILDLNGTGRVWMNGAQWMTVRDLEIRNSDSHGFYLTGQDGKDPASDNKFVNIVIRDSELTGWAVVKGSRNKIWHSLAIWAGSVSTPGDADGFGPGGQQGYSEGNACYGCVAVNAPDDGFDTWQSYETELIACTSIRAGEYGGDGNGFKLGRGLPPEGTWTHSPSSEWYLSDATVRACLAVDSDANGFDSNTGANADVLHCTSIGNAGSAFNFVVAGGNPTALPEGNTETNLLRNNLALGSVSIHSATAAIAVTNSWQGGTTIVNGDFANRSAPATSAFDGLTGVEAFELIENGTLARLSPSSTPISEATDLGYGTDQGAFQYA
jgi:hypothetical protein